MRVGNSDRRCLLRTASECICYPMFNVFAYVRVKIVSTCVNIVSTCVNIVPTRLQNLYLFVSSLYLRA